MADTIDVVLNSPRRNLLFGDTGVSINKPPRKLIAPGSVVDISLNSPRRNLLFGDTGASLTAPARTLYVPAGSIALTAPHRTLSAGDTSITLTAPHRTALISSITGTVLDAGITNPLRLLDIEEISSPAISVALLSPVRAVDSSFRPDFELTSPARTISASSIAGAVLTLGINTPPRAVLSTALHSNLVLGALSSQPKILNSSILSGSVMTLDRSARPRRLSSTGTAGSISDAALNKKARTLYALAATPNILAAALLIPPRFLDSNTTGMLDAQFRTWVLNLRKQALTEYDNFAFNSMTEFNGRILAAGPAGIFDLGTQDTDDAQQIAAQVLTGQNDFGTSFNKRVPRIYVGYKSAGDMEFHTVTSQDGARKYLLSRNGIAGIQQRRVPVGRGPKARYWQFSFVNQDGADFLLESMAVYPEKYNRRII